MILSENFYDKIDQILMEGTAESASLAKFKAIAWETQAQHCYQALTQFFAQQSIDDFNDNPIGVIDIRWNEYGGDIEVDFMPSNDLTTAFDEGCIRNDSAINNDDFFNQYFNCNGDDSFEILGDNYNNIITAFEWVLQEVAPEIARHPTIQQLPKLSPYYITFAGYHDETPSVLYKSQ